MSVIYIVLPLAIVLAAAALGAFIWAVKGGQFDDIDTPSVRILHDDQPINQKQSVEENKDDTQSERAADTQPPSET